MCWMLSDYLRIISRKRVPGRLKITEPVVIVKNVLFIAYSITDGYQYLSLLETHVPNGPSSNTATIQ